MKAQHLIPILFLEAFCTVSAQTNTIHTEPASIELEASNILNVKGRDAFVPPPPGSIQFDDSQPTIDVQDFLQVYKSMSGLELVIDSRAAKIHTPFKSHAKKTDWFTRANALKLIETNYLEEAGIVITHIDDKRVSVTYNDALPIKKQP